MRFTKMHGLGNDFILINGFCEKVPVDRKDFAITLCNRQLGIGADGVLLLMPSNCADAQFLVYNSDGSQAEMCGNGVRCAALFAKREGIIKSDNATFETLGGLVYPQIVDKEQGIVRVNMGLARLQPKDIPALFGGEKVVAAPLEVGIDTLAVTLVSMGNPHCVIFVDDVVNFPVEEVGPKIEKHPKFPAKTNVEFVQVLAPGHLKMRVWERGCGQTLACGTGSCASAVAAKLNGYGDTSFEVELACGSLFIELAADGHVELLGPATFVFDGEIY